MCLRVCWHVCVRACVCMRSSVRSCVFVCACMHAHVCALSLGPACAIFLDSLRLLLILQRHIVLRVSRVVMTQPSLVGVHGPSARLLSLVRGCGRHACVRERTRTGARTYIQAQCLGCEVC